jgi:hypothetical protein
VLLRGRVNEDKIAGPDKQAAIAGACRDEHWSAEIRECIAITAGRQALRSMRLEEHPDAALGDEPDPASCLAQLTSGQRASYDAALAAWVQRHPGEQLGAKYGFAPLVACDVGDVASYGRPLPWTGEEQAFAIALRRFLAEAVCDLGWGPDERNCFHYYAPRASGGAAVCFSALDDVVHGRVAGAFANADDLVTRALAIRGQAAAIDCAHVVEVHYGAGKWSRGLPMGEHASPSEIAASRARMAKACADERWSATLRACLVATDSLLCFRGAGMTGHAWSFPAGSPYAHTGIPECDAVGDAFRTGLACRSTEYDRDVARRIYEEGSAMFGYTSWDAVPPDKHAEVVASCKSMAQAMLSPCPR